MKKTIIATIPKPVTNETEADITDVLNSSFLDYSAFVLQRRALPDARDGMKYTARQILHAQQKEKLDCNHPKKKSQKSVAAATSFSYVHGDTSCYGQIIHMGRDLVIRYPLEDFTGNSGTIVGSDTYAAARYTECRLSELGTRIFDYIDEETLDKEKDWSPTYDDSDFFPLVLPTVGYYNLCNGSFGSIGVGLISSIPQFNLREVNETICNLIDNPRYKVELYPDFASGGILLNPKTTLNSLNKGEGKSALLRGEVKLYNKEGFLEVTSLPYGVYTETVCHELEEAYNKSEVPFTALKDLSKQEVRIRLYSKDLKELEAWLYKNTSVQKHFTIKMTMLDKGKTPKIFSITDALLTHIRHTKTVYRKHFEYQLNILKLRQEILEGLIKAYSILDDIIATIKKSDNRSTAICKLCELYNFSTRVSEAIVDLKLYRLTKLDIEKLSNELAENLRSQDRLSYILNNEEEFNALLKDDYRKVAELYGDNRRTQIESSELYESCENGTTPIREYYLLATNIDYRLAYQEDDEIFPNDSPDIQKHKILVALTDSFVIITNKGRCFLRQATDFKTGYWKWNDFIKLQEGERVIYFKNIDDLSQNYEIGGKYYDRTIIEFSASKRGRKFLPGQWDLTEIKEL